jgi:3-hydroxymyristoyl/3-hydroxydecanoyl-(acyl carrier protein) dehydratase
MPEPPLLLADRVLGIEGQPGAMGVGTIWTETDVTADAWYLNHGRMPAGILVESGQADLLLISWLGADFQNRGERVYRLLGCDLQSHGELPRPGDTLSYEIHVDGHATQGEIRLFFFHYDCRVNGELRVTVRNGQAGFFTSEELRNSAGVLWSAEEARPREGARLDPPAARCTRDRFSAADLDHFVAGRVRRCFGEAFARADTHTRTPTIQGGRMRLIDEVTAFDPEGGPWGRGYLKARLALRPDHWFFPGHFKNDPCMPGTLMFEGCVQAMSVYLTALGYTLDRDGWRFEPVSGETYGLRCRGQALPTSSEVIYEVFVEEVVAGPEPTLYADLLGTVDGLKAFHCRRMALRLVPDWPLDEANLPPAEVRPVARGGGIDFDYRSMIACAQGRPSRAFGAMYRPYDGTRRVPRLPGPPYHFISRIARVEGAMGGRHPGSVAVAEYDVPPDAWYFAANGRPVMPFCALLEVALQPCGWLASYAGAGLADIDLVFRNLDGQGRVLGEVTPDTGTLTTTATLKSISTAAGVTLVSFDVAVRAGEAVMYALQTSFGFFAGEAMRNQAGLPTTAEEQSALAEESPVRIELPAGRLRMIDRITGLWPKGGRAGLGRIRAEKSIDASDWFFKAHFFQDPVQPGSLGLEAMLQALSALTETEEARGSSIALDVPHTWKYRGQVVPENRIVTVDLEIAEARDHLALATGSLWVDGKRIYQAQGLGVRLR